jgi:hypothetical protein
MAHDLVDRTTEQEMQERFSNPIFLEGLKALFTHHPGEDDRFALKQAHKYGVFLLEVRNCGDISQLSKPHAHLLRAKIENMYRDGFRKYAMPEFKEVTQRTGRNFLGEKYSS